MGSSCDSSKVKRKKTLLSSQNLVSIHLFNKAMKSLCKITVEKDGKFFRGTGFFLKINDSLRYLITNYHIVSKDVINKIIELEISNHKMIKLDLNDRNVKYYSQPQDATVIEIKNTDELCDEVEYLNYDL